MSKTVEESRTTQVHTLRSQYLNGYGQLFGGQLMMWIDELAGIVARRHSEANVTTASVDKLDFKEPAYLNDIIVMDGRVTYTGNSSMEIRVDTYIEVRGKKRKINQAYVVMVAVDENRNPIPVHKLICEAEEELEEWKMGRKRYDLRKQRRNEGF